LVSPPVGEGSHGRHSFYTIDELLNRQAVAHFDRHENEKRWNRIRKGDNKRYKDKRDDAKELKNVAGLENFDGPCGIPEIKAIQNILDGYQIKIFS